MKKFFYLSALALIFASCSTDNDTGLLQEEAVQISTVDEINVKMMTANTVSCVSFLNGNVYIDVSQGINNPQVVFTADVPNGNVTRPARYNVHLEIQTLLDCEDLNSGTGTITRYSTSHLIPTLTDPSITLSPSQLPSTCYRWRFVVDGYKVTSTSSTPCSTTSVWYEEPLF